VAERLSSQGLTDDQRHVLVAVVEGYRAREGMKDRIRALNEWEIARRSDSTSLSHAEYMRDPMRDHISHVLGELERLGLISTWERGATYDSYVPTERGNAAAGAPDAAEQNSHAIDRPAAATAVGDPVVERLDEIIRVLRSIDSRLTS
jgi:hypothetical protein